MILLSILAKAYAFAFGVSHWPEALVCGLAGVVLDIFVFRGSSRGADRARRVIFRDVLAMNLGAVLAGVAVEDGFAHAAMRWKDGIPVLCEAACYMLRSLGLPVASFQGELHMTTMSGPLRFPVSLDGLGLLMPAWVASFYGIFLLRTAPSLRAVLRSAGWIFAILVLLALIRLVLATSLFLALCDFVSYESEELPVGPFFKPATIAAMYLPLLLVCWPLLARVLPRGGGEDEKPGARPGPALWALGLGFTALLLTAYWEPKGRMKSGAVLINTFHTQWSRTDRPYDRDWYGADSGYNYACLKRLLDVFYDVRELKGRIRANDLEGASVLIIYLPDQPFSDDEQRLIMEFVRRGGGLLLIGDHTNVFGSSSHLNEIAGRFGFIFRDDVLFDQEEDFFQRLDVPRLQPAFLHGMAFFKFRGAASIEPTSCFTRSVISLDNTKSLRAIYSVNNFYPPPRDDPSMRTGRFCVAAASRFGQGRVAAFADSTVFSNFEIFYPGKYEYLLNTVNWLNHADMAMATFVRRSALLAVVLLLVWSLVRAPHPRRWLSIMIVALLALHLARLAGLMAEHARAGFPRPARPARFLFFAADGNDQAYVLRDFTSRAPYDQRYDVFIQWVLRTGAFSAFHVTGPQHRVGLYEHLVQAGKVNLGLALIIRGPEQLGQLATLARGPGVQARRWLLMFSRKLEWDALAKGLSVSGLVTRAESLEKARSAWPAGDVLLSEGDRRLLLVFSAERFSDQAMGFSEKVVPDSNQRVLFDEAFSLCDRLFADAEETEKQAKRP
jgi:hypothetical protein